MIAANTSELSLVAVHVGYCAGRLQMRIFFRSFHWVLIAIIFNLGGAQAQTSADSFSWPDGNQAALSLSFDDSRTSQVDGGTALLNRLGVKVTFYVVPSRVEERLPGWKAAVASGHEIANHSLNHPCTGNFLWSRDNALESYTIETMRNELKQANLHLDALLGVKPKIFAYPCGQTFVGRGRQTRSYVPVVSELFASGRTWLDETANDPAYCDLAQLACIEMDGKNFPEIKALLDQAKQSGHWLILGGHEIGTSGPQTTRVKMLKKLIEYARNPANHLWMAPVGTVGQYVLQQR